MGNCGCAAVKNISSQEQSTEIPVEQVVEKRKGKKAMIISNEVAEMQDNIEYDEEADISPNDVIQIKKALNKHFIFSQLNHQEIDCFIKEMKPCTADRNNYIFKQGDQSGAYYIILEGVCQVEINGDKKRTLAYGDSFGDLGIVYNAPRSASVLALTECELVLISRQIFKKVMDDINQHHDKQNRKFLEVLSFFKDLTEDQKNAIASCCLTETYDEGQVIFNIGDAAHSFYVIKEGTVLLKEKGKELKARDCFGENSFLIQGGVRGNTLVAKTSVSVISMSSQNVKSSLGGSLKNVIKKNIVTAIIGESKLDDLQEIQKIKEAIDTAEFTTFKKGELVLKKDTEYKNSILVLLNNELRGISTKYSSNSVVQIDLIGNRQSFIIKEDMMASGDGCICEIMFIFEVNPSPISIQISAQHRVKPKEDKNQLEKKMQIGDFHVVRKLREGNFGKVYACYNSKTSKLYAIKTLDRHYVQKSQIIQYIMNEEEILRTTPKHPLIVSFYKLIKDANFIYFIMQLIEGEDLFDVITKVVSFTIEHARFLIGQTLLMMEHMHSNRIIYRDLKPENLMMNTDGYLTLVDMGTAKKLKIERRYRTSTIIGTPHYIAPEIITGKGYSFPVDLWSLGVLTYELLCGKLPFGENEDDPFAIYQEIINSTVKYPRNCPKTCKVFIEKMLNKSPQHRMGGGFEELKKHIFFEGLQWKKLEGKQLEVFYKPSEQVKIQEEEIQKALAKQKFKAPQKFLADKTAK